MKAHFRSGFLLATGAALGFVVAMRSGLFPAVHAQREPPQPFAELDSSRMLLEEVIDRVRREYVDRIDEERIIQSAIRGIVEELDQHSSYLDADQYEEIRISTSGNYTGVGLDVNLDDGRITVITPLDGAPAALAGILPGDVVISVDDLPIEQGNVEAAVNRMRGAAGTEVTLGVLRNGSTVPLQFALKRAEVQVKTVLGEYLGDGIGYLKLTSFSEHTPADLDAAVAGLESAVGGELSGLVVDLRNNPGGVLDAAVSVADSFLADGLIVRGVGRIRQARFEQYASVGGTLERVPTIVLVNGGSASASEIVAGALQDHGRAKIVGERTYGKGSVQTVMPLGEGSAIKLTTSRYLTPSGRSINGTGIEPDVVVRAAPKQVYRGLGGSASMVDDPQLLEALRLFSYDAMTVSAAPR